MSTLIKRNKTWVKVSGCPVTGMLHPDWSKAVSVTLDQIKAGYTMPADGLFIFTMDPGTPEDSYILITINNIEVSRGFRWPSGAATYITGQVPVNKGDIAKTANLQTVANNQSKIHFVPWKTEAFTTSDKQYISDQNELSDYESITLSSTATTMPYDGYLEVTWNMTGGENTGFDRAIYISGAAAAETVGRLPDSVTRIIVLSAAFKKGDLVTINNEQTSTVRVRYYKKRDYSMR